MMLPYPARALPEPSSEDSARERARRLQREINAKLNLAYQDLTTVPDKLLRKYAHSLRELDLTHNRIREFRFLLEIPNLETLILDHNGLTSHVKFPSMPRLHTLWINHNDITNLVLIVRQVRCSFPNLCYLSMMNNEAAPSFFNGGTYDQYKDYRYYVISQLSRLSLLDDTAVTGEERDEAERIYTRMSLSPPQTRRNNALRHSSHKSRKFPPGRDPPENDLVTRQQVHASLMDSLPNVDELTGSWDYTLDNALHGDSDEEPIDIRALSKRSGADLGAGERGTHVKRDGTGGGHDPNNSTPASTKGSMSCDTEICHSEPAAKKATRSMYSPPEDPGREGRGPYAPTQAEMTDKESNKEWDIDVRSSLTRESIMDSLPDLAHLEIYTEITTGAGQGTTVGKTGETTNSTCVDSDGVTELDVVSNLTRDPIMDSLPDLVNLDKFSELSTGSGKVE